MDWCESLESSSFTFTVMSISCCSVAFISSFASLVWFQIYNFDRVQASEQNETKVPEGKCSSVELSSVELVTAGSIVPPG